jgi:hypothetical protein
MVITWIGPGSLLLNGKRLVLPGQVVPDGALTPARIEVLRNMLTVKAELVVPVQPVIPVVVTAPQAALSVADPAPVAAPVNYGKPNKHGKAGPRW